MPTRTCPMPLARAAALLLAAIATAGVLATPVSAQPQPQLGGALPAPLPLLPADNWWNADISQAPVDPRSGAFITFIGPTRRLHPDFGADSGDSLPNPITYGIPYVVVGADQPLVPVVFEYDDESDAGAPGQPSGYPIPAQATTEPRWIEGGIPGGGNSGDRHMLIVDRDRRMLYELYALRWDPDLQRWEAGSGAVFPLDSNLRRPDGWTSADAAGLAILPGLIRYDEMHGTAPIRHAFRVTVRATNGYVFPGSHRAGSNASALPMGARLRLKASKDLTAFAPALRRVFEAMQTYGLIVADNGSDMYITGTHDSRWDMDPIVPAFRQLTANDFEVVELGWRPSAVVDPDVDDDGLDDAWERQAGLDPSSASGPDGAAGDPDGDGIDNAGEFAAGTHPRGTIRRYFAEGASSTFFTTRFAIFNPHPGDRHVLLRFARADGTIVSAWRTVPALTRATVVAGAVAGLAEAEFATDIEADGLFVADRLLSWDANGYGSHLETGLRSLWDEWHFAEGATHSGFELFYLLQNPNAVPIDIDLTFMRPAPLPAFVHRVSVGAHGRATVWANTLPELANTEVSMTATSLDGALFAAERSMYRSDGFGIFSAGHEAAGVTSPSAAWFFAEGATGDLIDTFLLLANPGDAPIVVDATYLLDGGQAVARAYAVGPRNRYTIWIDAEGAPLDRAAVSVRLVARDGAPFLAERAVWWPGPTAASWYEAHVSTGASDTAARWAVAETEHAAGGAVSTYVLVANTGEVGTDARVTWYGEQGESSSAQVTLPPSSRTTLDLSAVFPQHAGRGSVVVESLSAVTSLVVERALYRTVGGVFWAAGAASQGVPLP